MIFTAIIYSSEDIRYEIDRAQLKASSAIGMSCGPEERHTTQRRDTPHRGGTDHTEERHTTQRRDTPHRGETHYTEERHATHRRDTPHR